MKDTQKKAFGLSTLMLLTGWGAMATSTAAQSSSDANSGNSTAQLEEVVVTAQKKSQRLLDVPVPVSVTSAQSLLDSNQLRFQDYASSIPALTFSSGERGEVFPVVRGLTTGTYTNPTVGIVIDDVPFGFSAAYVSIPDIDPSDLKEIEVLRGPQGTLYGASSMGGLIKYVTVDPDTTATSGHVEVGTSSVQNGNDPGYNVRGAINLPISATFAIRASGFSRRDPGYIDDVVGGVNVQGTEKGVNETYASGGRLAALWRPSDTFSVKLSALVQRVEADGSPDAFVGSGFGDLQQQLIPHTSGYTNEIQAYSATVKAKLGGVDFTSLSGYTYGDYSDTLDISSRLGFFAQNTFGVSGMQFSESLPVKKYSQEFRFSSSGTRFDWLLGAFYTHESLIDTTDFYAVNPVNSAIVGDWGHIGTTPQIYQEYAVFGNITFHITDRFDLQVGGRQSHDAQPERTTVDTGSYASTLLGADPTIVASGASSENPFTYLFTPSFEFTPNLMAYIRLASGFRAGGPNTAAAATAGAPASYKADKTKNYELGLKGTEWDDRVEFDASLYRINWDDLQLSLTSPNVGSYFSNASSARSQGVELSTQFRPWQLLSVKAWAAWNDASLTEPLPVATGVVGLPGDQLPYGAHFSGSLSFEQRFPLVKQWEGFFGGGINYIGERLGDFMAAGTSRAVFPAYAVTNLRLGARDEYWTVNLFVDNLANRRGLLGGGVDNIPANAFLYIQPRTVGLSVGREF